MANGFTRLYKAIWYTQVGRALEQADRLRESSKMTYETSEDDISDKQENVQYDKQTDSLIENPEAVRGVYEDIIRDKQGNIQRYKNVIGQLIALVEQKKNSLKGLTDDIDKLEQLKAGTIEKKESITAKLQKEGNSDEEIEQHPDYVRCVAAYNDFHSTLEQKNARFAKLQQDIKRAQDDIESHKLQITELHRDLEKIKAEQSEAIADLIAARTQQEVDDLLSGISKDDT
jgi:phage shock protein A